MFRCRKRQKVETSKRQKKGMRIGRKAVGLLGNSGACVLGRIQGDLLDRSFRFAREILALVDFLPPGNKGWEIGRQLIRSGTSVGANLREADHAQTDAEFARCCSIARREASEALYWIELCVAARMIAVEKASTLMQECRELTGILVTIVRKTQYRQRLKERSPNQ